MDDLKTTRRERWAGIAFGLSTHALFGVTVWHLFQFLGGGHRSARAGSLWIDAGLALQFALPHSVILHPRGRQFFGRRIPKPLYGCFFCLTTCLSLLLLMACWRGDALSLWNLTGWAKVLIQSTYLASWIAMLYSMSLTGLGFQTGWTPWWHWVRNRPLPKRDFVPRGAYHWIRHPIYLSFLGLLWLTPAMTADRAVLTLIWTTYIFVGSHLKDERLAFYLGESYRDYQSRVPGYPFFPLRSRSEQKTLAFPGPELPSQEPPPMTTSPLSRRPDSQRRNHVPPTGNLSTRDAVGCADAADRGMGGVSGSQDQCQFPVGLGSAHLPRPCRL